MTAWQIVYYGQPAGMPRMRTRRTRYGVLHYVPPNSPGTLFRNAIRLKAETQAKLTGPVCLRIECIFAMPVSWSKAKRIKHDGRPHTQKPDGDNVAKAVMDGLTLAGVWPDDAVVWALEVIKVWGVQGFCTVNAVDSGKVLDDEIETEKIPTAQVDGERSGIRNSLHQQTGQSECSDRDGHRNSVHPNPWKQSDV